MPTLYDSKREGTPKAAITEAYAPTRRRLMPVQSAALLCSCDPRLTFTTPTIRHTKVAVTRGKAALSLSQLSDECRSFTHNA